MRHLIRCGFVLLLALGCLPLSHAAPGVAVLLSHDASPYRQALDGFKTELSRLGLRLSYREWFVDKPEALAAALAEMDREPPGLILTLGTSATRAVLQRQDTIPVVAGLILRGEELRAAANATGVILSFPVATQWRWFRRLLADVRVLGVLYDPATGTEIETLKELASRDNVTLDAAGGSTPEILPEVLKRLSTTIGALWELDESRMISPQTAREILLYSFRNRVPLVGLSSSWVRAGALYALERDYVDLGRQCAEIADAILKGRPASSIPPTGPRKVLYALNLKTAEHMKLEFPDEVVRGASEVFR